VSVQKSVKKERLNETRNSELRKKLQPAGYTQVYIKPHYLVSTRLHGQPVRPVKSVLDTLPTNFLHALSGTFSTHIHPVANTADQSAQCVKSCKISCSCCEWPVVPRPRDLVFQVWSEPRSRMRCINRTLYMICRLKFLVAASCTEIRAVWMLRRNMG
jgi:hypothetical protein